MAIVTQFSEDTEDAILARMLDGISDDVDKRQGSVAHDLTMPTALELAQAYVKLDTAVSFTFLNEDMPSDLLTMAASDFGVDRKDAVEAKGIVSLTGPIGQVVPIATQVRTDDGEYFTTDSAVTLTSGTATVAVTAAEGGIGGNVVVGEIDTVIGDLAGVVVVTNPQAFDGGVDEESDEALLARVYDKVRKPATSGNVYHYEQWAKEVSGVTDAICKPVWNGKGTVKVVLIGDNKRAPSPAVVTATLAHITENMPIGPTITVVGASELAITIDADLTIADGATLAEVTAEIKSAISAYLESLAFTDTLVRYTRIASLLLDVPRIVDYSNLRVNGGTANVQTTDEQVAVLGTVTANAL